MKEKFIIVGAGIAGLTLGNALQDLGVDFDIYEAGEDVRGIGAGFGLASNAMKAFEILGLANDIIPLGHLLSDFEIQDWKEKTILKADTDRLRANYNTENFAIHRADLHRYLYQRLNKDRIHTSKKFQFFQQNFTEVVVQFEDGTTAKGNYLIAADGLNSKIRQQLIPQSKPRYANYICWRAIVHDPTYQSKKSIETWGPNGRFGLTPLKDNQIYWYACVNADLNNEEIYAYDLTQIKENFKDYSGIIRSTLQKTKQSDLITAPIMDIKPINNYAFNRVLLIGDAAHATTPNMGQGACMAVEDVCVLVDEIKDEPENILLCFERYNLRRLKRTHYIIETSRLAGRVAQVSWQPAMSIRNFIFRNLPTSLVQSPLNDLLEEDFMSKISEPTS